MQSVGQLLKAFREWRHGPRGFLLTAVLLMLAAGAYMMSRSHRNQLEPLDYRASLELVAVVVNGRELTLRDLAYYVAHQEMEGQRRGELIDPDHPRTYWNTYIDPGLIVKEATRNSAMQMAVHDEIFYWMALENGIELSDEERTALLDSENDFWDDLSDYNGAERLGISREDLNRVMERIALAQRYQTIYALLHGADYEDYEYDKEAYQALLQQNECEIRRKVWGRVDFGNVVVDNS